VPPPQSGPFPLTAPAPFPPTAPAPFPPTVPAPFPLTVPESAPYKRRRGRTTLLVAVAAVLGVLAGGGLGYRVQQNREPTPLPPLTGPAPAQPKGAGPAVPELPASQDGGLVYQRDLLKLLEPTPKGVTEHERGWLSLLEYADRYERPDYIFTEFATNSFQRAVHTEWSDKHDTYFDVGLVQFRDEASTYAPGFFQAQRHNGDETPRLGKDHDLPDIQNGVVWGSGKPDEREGYEPEYEGRALAEIGNIYVETYVYSPRPVKSGTVRAVIEKQLERL
jgi:hypothetical protein